MNTPLAIVLTCAESIGDQPAADGTHVEPSTLGAVRDAAEVIREQVLRCRTITDQFLRFAR